MKRFFRTEGGTILALAATRSADGSYQITVEVEGCDPRHCRARFRRAPNGDLLVEIDGVSRAVQLTCQRNTAWVSSAPANTSESRVFCLRQVTQRRKPAGISGSSVSSPMTGRVVAVYVSHGQKVETGQPLLVIEAMKMEHELKSPRHGTIDSIRCAPGDIVDGGSELVVLAAEQPGEEVR